MLLQPGVVPGRVSLLMWGGHRVEIYELPASDSMKGLYAMTDDHSALLARLDQLKAADPQAMTAELIRAGLQELIEAEEPVKLFV